MDAAKMNQAIRIAKLYYELHYNQLEIAAREGISKSSVSRILKNAMDMGIIEVRIKDSVLANGNLYTLCMLSLVIFIGIACEGC